MSLNQDWLDAYNAREKCREEAGMLFVRSIDAEITGHENCAKEWLKEANGWAMQAIILEEIMAEIIEKRLKNFTGE